MGSGQWADIPKIWDLVRTLNSLAPFTQKGTHFVIKTSKTRFYKLPAEETSYNNYLPRGLSFLKNQNFKEIKYIQKCPIFFQNLEKLVKFASEFCK